MDLEAAGREQEVSKKLEELGLSPRKPNTTDPDLNAQTCRYALDLPGSHKSRLSYGPPCIHRSVQGAHTAVYKGCTRSAQRVHKEYTSAAQGVHKADP